MEIIDAWAQHPTKRLLEQPMFASLLRWMHKKEFTDLPLEHTIAAMEQANIAKSLICAWWGPMGALISNEEVAQFVSAFPDRFIGIASVDLYQPMKAVKELRRCVKELGFKALRIIPWLWNLPPDDRRYYPLYVVCVELDIPFCLQVGHTGPLCSSEPGRPIPYLDHVALDFPELKIVAGHIGFPWVNEMISLATKYPNVYIDTSAYAAHRYPSELVDFLKSHGQKKVLFGSNYPMITPGKCLEFLDKLELSEEARQDFLFANAKRVFNL